MTEVQILRRLGVNLKGMKVQWTYNLRQERGLPKAFRYKAPVGEVIGGDSLYATVRWIHMRYAQTGPAVQWSQSLHLWGELVLAPPGAVVGPGVFP